ncbi:MAG TPA: serine hydrolase domain-containing protein [Clostridia bacterium]|nr:serine hydrolase domain-containing protein [Clostridia bacterium]
MTDPRQRLEEGVRHLVDERKIISGIAVSYGNRTRGEAFSRGNLREVRLQDGAFVPDAAPLQNDSVFDLASVTKLFTCIAVLQLMERGKLRLDQTVGSIDKRFTNIQDVTIEDLLCFRAQLQTAGRMDAASSADEAEGLLFQIRLGPPATRKYYTDMGSMVLKYIVETVSDTLFWDYLNERIVLPFGMTRTFAEVPDSLLRETVDCNYERRIVNGAFWLDTACPPGTVHDPKARLLNTARPALCGHAGVFASLDDMTKLARGLLGDALLSRKTLLEIGVNRTGGRLPDGTDSQYMGYLCYSKQPDQTFSEVPAYFGNKTIALNGFTGNHFSVDPEKNQFMILLANRIHNRATTVTGRANPEDKTETILWDDGHTYIVSQNFVYTKDKFLKNHIGDILKGY